MLQYILTQSERYSAAELAQMAIEGGCGWITLHLPDMTDDDYNQTATLTVGVTADPYETDLVNALGAAFKQLFPNVTIEPVRISGSVLFERCYRKIQREKYSRHISIRAKPNRSASSRATSTLISIRI